ALVFTYTGLNEMAAIHYAVGYIYWPAVLGIAIPSSLVASLGARLNYVLPTQFLKYGFIIILLLTAIKMLF
ncbi:MAG: TSUP family transporter, partial [bacterium]|nr:TSUP family transporter [bacterium]